MSHVLASAAQAAGVSITAAGGANGILVLIAAILFGIAGIVAWFVAPRDIWATFISAGLTVFMVALLIGG